MRNVCQETPLTISAPPQQKAAKTTTSQQSPLTFQPTLHIYLRISQPHQSFPTEHTNKNYFTTSHSPPQTHPSPSKPLIHQIKPSKLNSHQFKSDQTSQPPSKHHILVSKNLVFTPDTSKYIQIPIQKRIQILVIALQPDFHPCGPSIPGPKQRIVKGLAAYRDQYPGTVV